MENFYINVLNSNFIKVKGPSTRIKSGKRYSFKKKKEKGTYMIARIQE